MQTDSLLWFSNEFSISYHNIALTQLNELTEEEEGREGGRGGKEEGVLMYSHHNYNTVSYNQLISGIMGGGLVWVEFVITS